MDRAYIDYARLYRIHQASALFVTHAKKSFHFKRFYSRPVDKSTGLRCDQTVKLTITQIYKCRWQIELFFKWIKQHLRIKAFYGNVRERREGV